MHTGRPAGTYRFARGKGVGTEQSLRNKRLRDATGYRFSSARTFSVVADLLIQKNA